MPTVPVLFALLAAFSNALNVVTQHKASIGDPAHSKGWRFVRYLFLNPLWLFGWVALAAAFVFQAIALHNGNMSVVQPLLVTELVFALVLRWVWVHQAIRAVTWWAAAVVCASLATFIAMSEPSGGDSVPTSGAWVSAVAATAGVAALLTLLGMSGSRGPAGGADGRRDVGVVGAGGHVHQGDDGHAGPVRRGRHVRPLARLCARRLWGHCRTAQPDRAPRWSVRARPSPSSSSSTRS